MPKYSLPCNVIIFGPSQVGKSTLTEQLVRRRCAVSFAQPDLLAVDNILLKAGFIEHNIGYTQDYPLLQTLKGSKLNIAWIDEGMLFFDNRESMKKMNVKLGKYLNVFGSRGFTTFILIQNLSNLDKRIIDLANVVIGLDKRGHGLVYMAQKNFAIFKTSYGFDRVQTHPELVEGGYDRGVYNLRKYVKSYVCDINWDDTAGNPFHDAYSKFKATQQGNVT